MNDMPPDPTIGAASVVENVAAFLDMVDPVMTLGKTVRDRMINDGWGTDLAIQLGAGILTFWLNQYCSLISKAVDAAIPPLTETL